MQPELLGYSNRLSAAPGETLRFMVSTDATTYDATIVRLIHGDNNPKGPGYKEEIVQLLGQQAGRKQAIYTGSFIHVPHHPALDVRSFTLQAWIYPTTPHKEQGIITKWSSAENKGYGLYVGESGALSLWIGDGERIERLDTGIPLRARQWYLVTAAYDADTCTARLLQVPLSNWPDDPSAAAVEKTSSVQIPAPHTAPLMIAAAYGETLASGRVIGRGIFNGKIDSPRIFSRALREEEIQRLLSGVLPASVAGLSLTAAWDFSIDVMTHRVLDTGQHGLHGAVINTPGRAVTGHNWIGREVDFRHAPHEYGAIYFHEDDLDDAQWETDFELTVPDTWKSGVYAARLNAGDLEDYVPFVVRPHKGKPTAPALYLLPTMTYLAYANYRAYAPSYDENGVVRQAEPDPTDLYLAQRPDLSMSLYDFHSDGSACVYSSRLRPIVNMRPKYRAQLVGAPRHFPADLYLIDWMEAKGFAYDVATDEDLHFDGLELLSQYKVILTGTHPEYWTTPMLTALEQYLNSGGRLMYLGGNGFYWVTSLDPQRPHVIEVRRGIGGTRTWESPPGENYHSTTGEPGGLWRYRGKAPNRIGGVGFTSQGWDGRIPGYMRQPGSFDPRAAFIFDGIGADEVIGDFGLVLNSAAGDEIDRMDYSLGTPLQTLLLARASGYARSVLPVIEDFTVITTDILDSKTGTVHADMVYFETANGGAVFSSSAITWCGSLSWSNYSNNVSRITENVLRRFIR